MVNTLIFFFDINDENKIEVFDIYDEIIKFEIDDENEVKIFDYYSSIEYFDLDDNSIVGVFDPEMNPLYGFILTEDSDFILTEKNYFLIY
jgi:hypothetical protein